MIQGISDVEANRARVKLPILKAYHPLVAGNRNEQIKAISKATGAAIHVPPSLKAIDEITITGEKKAVEAAAAQITAIYEALRVSCGELAANIKKSQHRSVLPLSPSRRPSAPSVRMQSHEFTYSQLDF
jgi:hypothetical protein